MAKKEKYGDYIVLGGRRLPVEKHPTDFSVMADPDELGRAPLEEAQPMSPVLSRARCSGCAERDQAMKEVRREQVAHHIYRVKGTGEEIVIDDRLILDLRREDTGELERIIEEYRLVPVGQVGGAHLLRLTGETSRNPIKLSNELAEREEVASAEPQVMLDLQRFGSQRLQPARHQPARSPAPRAPALRAEQWHLDASSLPHSEVSARAGICALEAWEITKGCPGVVAAVIDDGFDLGHPSLAGARIHPDAYDFARDASDVSPGADDYHGTPVASVISSPHRAGSPLLGVAPGCTLLPIRIRFGPAVSPEFLLEVFRYASERADVVNCSFGRPPSSSDQIAAAYRRALTRLCETGGRRGRGLVMVFSAANHDAPTFLRSEENKSGILFPRRRGGSWQIGEIPPGEPVFSGFPMTPGVVTVGAVSSLGRKSGYSGWGPHLSVVAPSSNLHYIPAVRPPIADERRALFEADYRGLGVVAAVNRPGHGRAYRPAPDDPDTPEVQEDLYTREFGGTSSAAPVVSGVAALMLSVNPDLSAREVRQILMATADRDLDPTLDLAGDPNLQGLQGEFSEGRSRYFGAGKVNAFRAVRRARALARPGRPDPPGDLPGGSHNGERPTGERPERTLPEETTCAPEEPNASQSVLQNSSQETSLKDVLRRLRHLEALLGAPGEEPPATRPEPRGPRLQAAHGSSDPFPRLPEPFDDREPREEGRLREEALFREEALLMKEDLPGTGRGARADATPGAGRFAENVASASSPRPALTAPPPGSRRLEAFLDRLGLRFFRGAELTPYWSRERAGARNGLPPESLWPGLIPTLVVLDRLRGALGAPIRLTSTYRSPAYNRAVGGADLSQHLRFRAADFTCGAGRPEEWGRRLRSYRGQLFDNPYTGDAFAFRGGIGVYPSRGFVHVDTRGWDRDWRG